MPKSGIARPYGSFTFSILRNCHAVPGIKTLSNIRSLMARFSLPPAPPAPRPLLASSGAP